MFNYNRQNQFNFSIKISMATVHLIGILRGDECCAQVSALDSRFDVTIHSCNDNHVYIPYTLFSGLLYFFLMVQSYLELVIITLKFAYQTIFQDFSLSVITTDDQINLGTLIECFHRLIMY